MQTFIGIQGVTKRAVHTSIGGEDFNLDSITSSGGQKKKIIILIPFLQRLTR